MSLNPYQPPAHDEVVPPPPSPEASSRLAGWLALAVAPLPILGGLLILRARLLHAAIGFLGYGFHVGLHALGMYAAPQATLLASSRGRETRPSRLLGALSVTLVWATPFTPRIADALELPGAAGLIFLALSLASLAAALRAVLLLRGWRRPARIGAGVLGSVGLLDAAIRASDPVLPPPDTMIVLGWTSAIVAFTLLVPERPAPSLISAPTALRWVGLAPAIVIFTLIRGSLAVGSADLILHDTWVEVASLHAAGAIALLTLALALRETFCEEPTRAAPIDAVAAALFGLALHATTWFMFDLGRHGMPRRYASYLPELAPGHRLVTQAGVAVAVAAAVLIVTSFLRRSPAPSTEMTAPPTR